MSVGMIIPNIWKNKQMLTTNQIIMIEMNIDFLIDTTNIHQPGHLHSSRLAPAWHQRSPAPQRHSWGWN
jgi:hypothetical protein